MLSFDLFYLLSQVFALGDKVFSLVAMQRRRKKNILQFNTLAASCGVFHYALLGAWPGMITKAISATRNGLATYKASKMRTSVFIPVLFVVLYIVIGIYSFKNWASLLPIAAATIYTIAIYRTDASRIRKAALVGTTLWLIYNICVSSVVGMVGDVVIIINELIAIYRYRARKEVRRKRTN